MGDSWFEIWYRDRQAIIGVMHSNMADDLANGYNFFGQSIQKQIREINEVEKKFSDDLERIGNMDPKRVNHWCKMQLLKSGAIEI